MIRREAIEAVAGAHRLLLLGEHHLEAAGLSMGSLLADVGDLHCDLGHLAHGRARLADVPRAGLPAWAREATVAWREERDRQQRGRRP